MKEFLYIHLFIICLIVITILIQIKRIHSHSQIIFSTINFIKIADYFRNKGLVIEKWSLRYVLEILHQVI